MNAFDAPEITLRLRHLNGIKGRNFVINQELSDLTGVIFAVSLLGPENFGYFFVSPICENVNYPEWEALNLSDVSQWLLASKGAVFTFFAVQGQTNVILFEMEVYFSGLIAIDAEAHAVHTMPTAVNEVYFQFNGTCYSPPTYLSHTTCTQCVRPKPTFRMNPKPSYDFEELQQFLVHSEIMKHQLSRMKVMTQSMDMLQTSLSSILDQSAKREAGLVELHLLRRRLLEAQATVNELRSKLDKVSKQHSVVANMLEHLASRRETITEQISTVSRTVDRIGSHMAKLERAMSCRIAQLIRQLVEIFGTELKALDPRNTLPSEKLLVAEYDATRSIAFVPLNPSQLKVDGLTSSIVNQQATEEVDAATENHKKPVLGNGSNAKTVNPVVEPDLALAASNLGMIAQMLRFIAAVLNHPLRYPVDLTEGTSRAKVSDCLAQELFEGDQNFPLYLSRSSLLPAYKHAMSLLNRNLAELRAFVGLPTPVEETTAFNLRTLLQHCLSESVCLRP